MNIKGVPRERVFRVRMAKEEGGGDVRGIF